MKIMTIQEFAARIGVVPSTVRKWEKSGKISPARTTGGHRRYTERDIKEILRSDNKLGGKYNESRRNVIYCRVAYPEQEEELMRQARDMEMFARGRKLETETIIEIGDGGSMSRPKLEELVKDIVNGAIATVMVTSKNRLLHTGFEVLENIAKACGCEIISVDSE